MLPVFADVNGIRTSYCSITFGINGVVIPGVRSINYRETHEVGKIRGTSPKPIGRTRGEVDFEGDIELYQKDWLRILPLLSIGGTVGFAETAWPVHVAYSELLSQPDTVLDTLLGVRFLAPDSSGTEGPEAQIIKLNMSIMDILWHGYQGLRTQPL